MLRSKPSLIAQSAANLWRVWLLLACGCGGLVAGCNGASTKSANPPTAASHGDHDHGDSAGHDHDQGEHEPPASYAEAVTQLETLRNTIRDAFAKNDAEAAHGPLHDVGHILESLPPLADKAGLDATQKDSVKTAAEQLFEHFGKVDEMMHGEEGAKYGDVASKIDEAVATLKGLAATK